MTFTFNSLLNEIQLHLGKLLEALVQDDLGLLFMYTWAEILGLGLFLLGLFLRNHMGWLKKYEATVAGIDFSDTKLVEPVCEYIDDAGNKMRARFNVAIPSFSTGHKATIYVEKNNPTSASLPVMGYPLGVIALIIMAGGLIGAWCSFQEAASVSGWINTSLKDIALTEVVLLCCFMAAHLLEALTKKQTRAKVQKLLDAKLIPFEDLSEVDDRIGQFRRSMRVRRDNAVIFTVLGCLALYMSVGTVADYALTEPAVAHVSVHGVAHSTLPPELAPLPPPDMAACKQRRKLKVDWVAPSGKIHRLTTGYPSAYLPLKEYRSGDKVAIRLNPEDAQKNEYYEALYDPGPVVAVFHSLIGLLLAALLFCLGKCMKLPQDWRLCKDSAVLLSPNH